MKYTITKTPEPEPKIKRYSIELQNLTTGGIAITHVETITLNIEELKKSLPDNYKYITYWYE